MVHGKPTVEDGVKLKNDNTSYSVLAVSSSLKAMLPHRKHHCLLAHIVSYSDMQLFIYNAYRTEILKRCKPVQ